MEIFFFQWVEPIPTVQGVAKIDVTFSIDVNGIVHVTAKDPVLNKVATGAATDHPRKP